jgi:hypothetical protein
VKVKEETEETEEPEEEDEQEERVMEDTTEVEDK